MPVSRWHYNSSITTSRRCEPAAAAAANFRSSCSLLHLTRSGSYNSFSGSSSNVQTISAPEQSCSFVPSLLNASQKVCSSDVGSGSGSAAIRLHRAQHHHHHHHHRLHPYLAGAGVEPIFDGPALNVRSKRMRTRKSNGTYKMDMMRKKYPNHTDLAYKEAVSKLKYYLSESYSPKIGLTKPLPLSKRLINKENVVPQMTDEYAALDDVDTQSVMSDFSKKEPSTRAIASKYYPSRLGQFPSATPVAAAAYSSAINNNNNNNNNDKLVTSLPANEMSSFIGRQDEYIEQLEKELEYCKEQLMKLMERVREVVAENQALQGKIKNDFIKTVLDSYPPAFGDDAKLDYNKASSAAAAANLEDSAASSQQTSSRLTKHRLEGPSIVFESRISELEAQLTQARLDLRKSREENQENVLRLSERSKDELQPSHLHQELERASREKRELEARLDELQRELAKQRSRDTDVELRSKRAMEVVQQAEFDKAHAEAEVRRLKDELERRQEKLREALQETNRRIIEEKQLIERRYSQQMEQLSADMASHWEAASKSHLEAEKQKREITDLRRELGQKSAFVEDAKKELQAKTAKLQEELNAAIAEKDASQEEVASIKLALERSERQARQEQNRLQTEINSYKQRLERADADLMHARRENLRLTEEIAGLEKEINMNKIVEETRVGAVSRPPSMKFDRSSRDDKDKEKELASLIFDLENKQAKTVASLEESLSRQAGLVSRLTEECQSLTRRLEANDQKHKKEMADLQSNVDYLSSKIRESIALREQSLEELAQSTQPQYDNSEQSVVGQLTASDSGSVRQIDNGAQETDSNNAQLEKYNLKLHSARQSFETQPEEQVNEDRDNVVDVAADYSLQQEQPQQQQPLDDQNYSTDQQLIESNYQDYNQYDQYDPAQYADYYSEQQRQTFDAQQAQDYTEEQEQQQYNTQNNNNEQYQISSEPYLDRKENYKDESFGEDITYKNYSNK